MTATTDLDRFCLDIGATGEEVMELSEDELKNALDMLRHFTLAQATGSTIEEVVRLSEDEINRTLEVFSTNAMLDKEKVIYQWRERKEERMQDTISNRSITQEPNTVYPSEQEQQKQLQIGEEKKDDEEQQKPEIVLKMVEEMAFASSDVEESVFSKENKSDSGNDPLSESFKSLGMSIRSLGMSIRSIGRSIGSEKDPDKGKQASPASTAESSREENEPGNDTLSESYQSQGMSNGSEQYTFGSEQYTFGNDFLSESYESLGMSDRSEQIAQLRQQRLLEPERKKKNAFPWLLKTGLRQQRLQEPERKKKNAFPWVLKTGLRQQRLQEPERKKKNAFPWVLKTGVESSMKEANYQVRAMDSRNGAEKEPNKDRTAFSFSFDKVKNSFSFDKKKDRDVDDEQERSRRFVFQASCFVLVILIALVIAIAAGIRQMTVFRKENEMPRDDDFFLSFKIDTDQPSPNPTGIPTAPPSLRPTQTPSLPPSPEPSVSPSARPSSKPSPLPTSKPSAHPTFKPSALPTSKPSPLSSTEPTTPPSVSSTQAPTRVSTPTPSSRPNPEPATTPTKSPSVTGVPVDEMVTQIVQFVETAGVAVADDQTSPTRLAVDWLVQDQADQGSGVVEYNDQFLQRFAVLVLDFAMAGNNRQRNKETCLWGGISCTTLNTFDSHRVVTKIRWDRQGLQGTIPSEIGLLSNLQYFSAPGNNLQGSLPEEIYTKLPNLKSLYLYKNRLTGSISDSIGNLYDIEDFHLSHNEITGTIPESFQSVTAIRSLRKCLSIVFVCKGYVIFLTVCLRMNTHTQATLTCTATD